MGIIGFRGLYPFTKKTTIGQDIKQLKEADFYNVPLKLKGIQESEPAVEIGAVVKQGTLIAKPFGKFGVNIYSPVSGKVLNIVNKMTASGEYVKHMLIMNDSKGEAQDLPQIESISDINLISRLRDAGIVDTISKTPAYLKYAYVGARSYKQLFILADSTDPNNAVNQTLTEFRMEEVVNGAKYFMNITSAQIITFVFTESNHRLAEKLKKHIRESKKNYDFRIKFIPDKYPFDNPYILTKILLHKTIDKKRSFLQEGIAIESAENCYNFCRAVEFNKPVISKFITVEGDNISRPGTYTVLNGCSYKALLDEVGINEPSEKSQLIDGNILSGTALYETDLSMTFTTDTVIMAKFDILKNIKESPCISCGKCVGVCPVFINPQALDAAYLEDNIGLMKALNVQSCIECGCCSYVCPSKRFLTQRIVAGKYYEKTKGGANNG